MDLDALTGIIGLDIRSPVSHLNQINKGLTALEVEASQKPSRILYTSIKKESRTNEAFYTHLEEESLRR
jgi:hypothetical protein